MPQWSHHTWVRVTWIFSTRVHTLMCARSCSACLLHLFAVRLGRTQFFILILLRIAPLLTELTFERKQQHSKFWIIINFHLNYHSLPCRMKRNSLVVKREHDDISLASADWLRIFLLSVFINWNVLRHKKLSLICIANRLNRGTDPNRLLISLSRTLKEQT